MPPRFRVCPPAPINLSKVSPSQKCPAAWVVVHSKCSQDDNYDHLSYFLSLYSGYLLQSQSRMFPTGDTCLLWPFLSLPPAISIDRWHEVALPPLRTLFMDPESPGHCSLRRTSLEPSLTSHSSLQDTSDLSCSLASLPPWSLLALGYLQTGTSDLFCPNFL